MATQLPATQLPSQPPPAASSSATPSQAPPAIEVRVRRPFAEDLQTFMCARELVTSRSLLTAMLLTSSRLAKVFTYEEPGLDFIVGSCSTEVWVADEVRRERKWAATPTQQLAMLVEHHEATRLLGFHRALVTQCLGLRSPSE